MSLQPGQQVTPTLRLVRLIGRGAMGSVWLADHLGLQSQVAVKFMAPAMHGDENAARRFQQEAKAAAEIRSPHVVQVFDSGTFDTPGGDRQLYIVMELLEGMSLDKWVRTRGAFTAQMLSTVVTQSCKALAKAHERGIIHRDIKPPNVYLIDSGGDPFVKLLDFGVAKFSGEEAIHMTAAGNMVGTPAFMSPEQLFQGKENDHRGDLWSLAVVAYYALIGQRPFEGKTLGELCVSIRNGSFPMPSQLRNDLPPDIDGWFSRAFHADLAARFQTAKEMAQELERLIGVTSTMSSTPSSVAVPLQTFPGTTVSSHASLARPREPRRWPMAVAAAFVVAFGVVAAAFLLGDAPAQSRQLSGPVISAAAQPPVIEPVEDSEDDVEVEVAIEPPASASAPPKAAPPVKGTPPAAEPKTTPGDDRSKRAAEQLGI